MNREFNIACMHAAKRALFSTIIKSAKTFLKAFLRKFIYPRNIPAIRYNYAGLIGMHPQNNYVIVVPQFFIVKVNVE